MKIRPHALALAAVLVVGLSAPAAAPAAEALFGVTSSNTLITFASDSPGQVRSAVPVTGLQPGEVIHSIDVRPATGQLYALGSSNRIYVVSPVSGAAKAVNPNPFSPSLAGTSFGFDFQPGVDRVRLTSDGRQNLRLNPDDGAVAAQDNQLAYADGDAGAGTNPNVAASAYTAEAEPRLFGIEIARDALVLQSPPNDGKLTTVGPLNVDLQEQVSFDIDSAGRGIVAARRSGAGASELFLVDLEKGGLTSASLRPTISTAYGDVRGIAAAGGVPDDKTKPAVLVAVDRQQPKSRLRRRLTVPVSCSEACAMTAELFAGSRSAGGGAAELPAAGTVRIRVNPTKLGRRLGRKARAGEKDVARRLTLRVTVDDAAGNTRTITRKLTFK